TSGLGGCIKVTGTLKVLVTQRSAQFEGHAEKVRKAMGRRPDGLEFGIRPISKWLEFDHDCTFGNGALPSTHDPPIDRDKMAEDGSPREPQLFKLWLHCCAVLFEARHRFVVIGEQVGCWTLFLRRWWRIGKPVALTVDDFLVK